MINEMEHDIENGTLYFSKRFNAQGRERYVELLRQALSSGNEESLADSLSQNGCFEEFEKRGEKLVKVPVTAPKTFSDGEFNRFYMRALSVHAKETKRLIVVYRANSTVNPRTESEALIGVEFNSEDLLKHLRSGPEVDAILGLPPGPNSGLSIKLN
jgi:hypothetical protein